MRKIVVLLFSIICINLHGQKLIPFLENGMYGYMSPMGEIIIPSQFESATDFNNFSLIESETYKLSKEIVDAYFEDKPKFRSINIAGTAQVKIDGKWTFIDSTGKMLFPPSAENRINIGRFPKGIYSSNAEKIDLLKMTDVASGDWGLINSKTHKTEGLIYQNKFKDRWSSFPTYHQKYVIANRKDGTHDLLGGYSGLVILSKKKLIRKVYKDYYTFVDQNGDWYIYNVLTSEKLLIQHKSKNFINNQNSFNQIGECPFLVVGSPGRLGMIDLSGNLVVDKIYDKIVRSENEFIANDKIILSIDYKDVDDGECIKTSGANKINHRYCNLFSGKVQLLQATGLALTKPYDAITFYEYSNVYQFKDEDESGLMDMFGLEFLRCKSDDTKPLYTFDCSSGYRAPMYGSTCFSGLYIIKKEAAYGLVNDLGKEIYPTEYLSFSLMKKDKLLRIQGTDNKLGIGNIEGKILIPVIYDNIRTYNAMGRVSYTCTLGEKTDKYDYKFNLINPQGNKQVEKLVAHRLKNGKYNLQDSTGRKIVDTEFDALNGYFVAGTRNSLVMVAYQDKDNRIQIFNSSGKKIYNEQLDSYDKKERLITIAEVEGIIVNKNEKQGLLHTSGKYIIEPDKYVYLMRGKNRFLAGFLNKEHYLPFVLYDHYAKPFFKGEVEDILVAAGSYIIKSKSDFKFGVIGIEGDTLEQFEYDDAYKFRLRRNSKQSLDRYKDTLVGYPLVIDENISSNIRFWRTSSMASVVTQLERKASSHGTYSGCYYLLKKEKTKNKVFLKRFNKLLYSGAHDSITEINFKEETLLAYNGKDSIRISYKAPPQKEYGKRLGSGLFYVDDEKYRTFLDKDGIEITKTEISTKAFFTILGNGKGALWGNNKLIILNQDGKVNMNLECDTDIEAIPGSQYFSKHFLLLENNLIKLFFKGKPYLYDFENNVCFKK